MKFADRLKVSSTGTSAAALAMGSATAKCRTLAQVIASLEMSVGDTNVPFVVEDSTGNWESGLYTITSSTFITRTQILNSSNLGSPVTFDGGALTVYNGVPASTMNMGFANPHDPGFDIIICAGQSNMVGQDTPATALDIPDPRVFSFGGYATETATYQKITQAVDPLRYNYSQASLPSLGNGSGLSPAQWFAKTYAGMIPSNRKVLLVPVARSATYLVAQTAEWAPGDSATGGGFLYENAISQANAAVVAAQKMYPNSRVVGTIWLQGESDASWTISQINYVAALKTLIYGFRTRITGATNSWFVIMGMIGEFVANTASGSSPAYNTIDLAHRQVATEFPRCAYTQGITGYAFPASTVHYNADGARIMGCNAAGVAPQAMLSKGSDTTAPTVLRAAVSSTATSIVAVTLSEPIDPVYAPQASAWTVTGHTVTAASATGNVVYLTVSTPFVGGEATRTVTFTAPGNGIRDFAGNQMLTQSPVNITNNAPANASAVTLTGPTSGTYGQASTAFTVGVSPVGSNISGTVVVTPSDGGAGGTFTPTTLSLTTASPSGTFTYTPPSVAATYTVSVTNNGSLTNPSSISYVASAPQATTVTSVTVSPSTASLSGNGTQTFTATVSGTGSPAQTVTWAATSGTITSGGVFTAPSSTASVQTITVTATSTVDNTKSGTATVSVAASAGTDIRFADLYSMTETSSVAPYAYKENAGVSYSASNNGGTSTVSAAGDFTFTVKVGSVSSGQQMISFKTASVTTTYANTLGNLMAKTAGYNSFAGTLAATVNNSTIIPADNDLMRLARTGTTVTAQVSKDSGATWTTIVTWTSVSSTLYMQILSASNGTFTAPQGTGFA
jgi:hypothetical protein